MNRMPDFSLIQDDAGFVWRYYGASPPDGHKWYKEAGSGRNKIAGDWKENAPRDTQEPIVEICAAENEDKVPCDVFSRVVGYITAVKRGKRARWNKGKFQEFKERATYRVDSMEKLEAMEGNGPDRETTQVH